MKSFLTKGMALSVIAALLVIPALAQQVSQSAKPAVEKVAPEKVNLNTGTLDDLQKLPGVGPKVAQRILDFRKQNGPFKKIEDLLKVKGIGEKTFGKFKDMLTV